MERQRAPPKGREAKNGSRGIDSRGRIPERLCRQWKKNYKKKHGVNPPLELDKRKQRRLARKMARQINKTLPTAAETLTAAINRWAQSIKPALATLCENVAAAFSNMAAGLREESEAVEND